MSCRLILHGFSTPLRCAVYVRVSVADRQDADMPSIEVQTQSCLAYIEAHRQQNWQAIDAVYADNGYSGVDLQRPALRRLLDDMQSDKVDAVVVHRLDRLSRSVRDLCILLPLFTIPGVRLVSVTQPLDTATPEGRLNLHLLTSFAQFEREITSYASPANLFPKASPWRNYMVKVTGAQAWQLSLPMLDHPVDDGGTD